VFRLGFSTIGCPNYDIDQIIELASSNGFEGVELRFVRGTIDLASLEEFAPSNIVGTRQRFNDAGIEVVGVDTSVRMNSLDPKIRSEQLELAKRNLAIAEGLGASFLRVFGGAIPEGQTEGATRGAIAEGLSRVADLTAVSEVSTLLETHDSFSTSESILDLYANGASENLAVLWDSLHTFRHGEAPEYTWQQLGPHVRHVHVKDSTQASADSFDFALTGEGNVPIPTIIRVLRNVNYEGFVSFEWEKGWHSEIAEPEVAIPHFARYIAGLL